MNGKQTEKARLVGINHVALEVGDIDGALDFYSRYFDFTLRGRSEDMAFIDMGDQFLALAVTDNPTIDEHRHFGLVVDNRSVVLKRLKDDGIELIPGKGLNFRDPWGNFIQIVEYRNIQYSKTDAVMQGMGLDIGKTDDALTQLRDKGLLL